MSIKIAHSMSESAREGLDLLKRGAPALKHGRAGKPHATIFTLSKDESTLTWLGNQRSSIVGSFAGKKDKKRELNLSDVVELLVGRESAVFKRRKDKDKDDNEHLSLSLVTKGALPAPPSADGEDEPDPTGGRETLDVSFDSDENFGLWLAALKYLLTRNQQADLSKKKTNDLASDLFGTRPSSSYSAMKTFFLLRSFFWSFFEDAP